MIESSPVTSIVRNESYFPHGIDVAYSTVITARLRQKLPAEPWPDTQYRPAREAYEAAVNMKMDTFYELYSEEKIADTILYAKELLDRYRVLWMYYHLFSGNPV